MEVLDRDAVKEHLKNGASDVRYIFEEVRSASGSNRVHKGWVTNPRRLANFAEDETTVRTGLCQFYSLDLSEGLGSRMLVAVFVSAWRAERG